MANLIFWAVTAALALAITGLMIAANARGQNDAEPASSDLKVYKDQLREVERDLGRGVISADEAARLRTEIGRRVLAADAAGKQGSKLARGPSPFLTIALIVPVLFVVAFGFYAYKGSPDLPDQPMRARLVAAEDARAARPSQAQSEAAAEANLPKPSETDERHVKLVEELRRTLAERPDDLEGHRLLARNESLLGNLAAAAKVQTRVTEILGNEAQVSDLEAQAGLMIMAAGGRVSPEAEAVLSRILSKDLKNGFARYYSGLSLAETGRYDLAFRFWAPLWADSKPSDPWVPVLERELPDLAWAAGQHRYELPPMAAPTRGPDAAAIAAAGDMTDADRAEMVQNMVSNLMSRLATQGGTAEEWAQLIRALGVMGDQERGRSIVTEARERFATKPDGLQLIDKAARDAGFSQ